jgi:hypothetical protein
MSTHPKAISKTGSSASYAQAETTHIPPPTCSCFTVYIYITYIPISWSSIHFTPMQHGFSNTVDDSPFAPPNFYRIAKKRRPKLSGFSQVENPGSNFNDPQFMVNTIRHINEYHIWRRHLSII